MNKIATLIIFSTLILPVLSHAVCGVVDAKVTNTHRYSDGTIFVNFDKYNDCGCSQSSRLAFHEDDTSMDYVKSMILIAYTTGAKVRAQATNAACSVHGNTSVLDIFSLD